jgi:hypothetical protein
MCSSWRRRLPALLFCFWTDSIPGLGNGWLQGLLKQVGRQARFETRVSFPKSAAPRYARVSPLTREAGRAPRESSGFSPGSGYRNFEHFRNAIYSHLGGLDLNPLGDIAAMERVKMWMKGNLFLRAEGTAL